MRGTRRPSGGPGAFGTAPPQGHAAHRAAEGPPTRHGRGHAYGPRGSAAPVLGRLRPFPGTDHSTADEIREPDHPQRVERMGSRCLTITGRYTGWANRPAQPGCEAPCSKACLTRLRWVWCIGRSFSSRRTNQRTSCDSSLTAIAPPVTRARKHTLNWRRTSPSL